MRRLKPPPYAEVGRQRQQQIPCESDRQKSKGKDGVAFVIPTLVAMRLRQGWGTPSCRAADEAQKQILHFAQDDGFCLKRRIAERGP